MAIEQIQRICGEHDPSTLMEWKFLLNSEILVKISAPPYAWEDARVAQRERRRIPEGSGIEVQAGRIADGNVPAAFGSNGYARNPDRPDSAISAQAGDSRLGSYVGGKTTLVVLIGANRPASNKLV